MLDKVVRADPTPRPRPRRPAAPARPRVVVRVVPELSFGGTEQCVASVLPGLAAQGVLTHFVTLSDHVGPGPLADLATRYGGRMVTMPLNARFPVDFVRLLRRIRPDAVHVECANFSGAILSLAAVAGVPIRIAHFRGDDNMPRNARRQAQRWLLQRMLDASATDLLGISPSALTFGYRAGWEADPRCRVILDGLALDRLTRPSDLELRTAIGAAPTDLVCLTVGRASTEKRRWLLPPILAALRAQGVAAHAVLVGPGDAGDDARVRRAAAEHGVADRVHLLGARDDVGGLLGQADVVVHPSCLEGLPTVILEAAALGAPAVAADLPGVRFIAERLGGVEIVATEAAASTWARAVRRAATAESDRATALARFRASVFDADAAVASYLELYGR
ncbi:glycosyltransferase [Micromonospora radicis]|nr:glycosyltransferase [Micromonospora radicis]